MTGAPVPEGADCVIMVEDTEILPSGKLRFKGTFTKENIAFRAEDVKKGDIVLKPGRIIQTSGYCCNGFCRSYICDSQQDATCWCYKFRK